MIERQGTWGELVVGGYLRDAKGVTWRVDGINPATGIVGIMNQAGEAALVQPKPSDTPVTLVERTSREQLELLRAELGAELYAERDRSARDHGHGHLWVCPPFPSGRTKTALMHAKQHLEWVHQIGIGHTKEATMKALTEAHDLSHQRMREQQQTPPSDPRLVESIPHVHRTSWAEFDLPVNGDWVGQPGTPD